MRVQHPGQRPKEGRGEPGDKGQLGDAALRDVGIDLHQQGKGGAILDEVGSDLNHD